MNLLWVVLLTAVVAIEKVVPAGLDLQSAWRLQRGGTKLVLRLL